jgi:hypothetical protein
MKETTKDNLKIALSAWMTIAVMYGFIAILYWAGLDWEMWFAFAMGTAMVFGILIAKYSRDLKKPRCFLVFVLLVVVYAGAWFFVLKSGIRLPDSAYIFGSPFEGALAAFILSALGGARGNSLGRINHRVRLSPKTYKSSGAEKEDTSTPSLTRKR